jgi:FtsZ-interacting cell division protein YlmF
LAAEEIDMKNKMRRAMNFLGLVEDDYNDFGPGQSRVAPEYDDAEYATPARVFPTAPAGGAERPLVRPTPERAPLAPRPLNPTPVRASSPISVLDANGVSVARVRPVAQATGPRPAPSVRSEGDVALYVPMSFNDAKDMTNHLVEGRIVLVKLDGVEHALSRRIVDYACGTTYALKADIKKLRTNLYLLSPHGVSLNPDALERLRDSY